MTIEKTLTILYAIDSFVLVAMYWPQIKTAWEDQTGCQTISLLTWGVWTVSSLITLFYAIICTGKWPFIMMSVGNLIGTIAVFLIAVVRRRDYEAKRARSSLGEY